jgi:uroporphyrinogen-III synthase
MKGKRIVVTRAPHQAAELADLLRERGAAPLLYPCIDIAPPNDSRPLDNTIAAAVAGEFDWLVLTSTNTVEALAKRLQGKPLPASMLVAAVGSATAEAAQTRLGLNVSAIPDEYLADALAGILQSVRGKRVLLPQSAIAETALMESLIQAGAQVTAIEAYRTIVGQGGIDLPALLRAGDVDVITLTSSSTVTNLLQRLELENGNADLLANVCIACIGPKTAATAVAHGLTVALVPTEHTLEGLVAALEGQPQET